MIETIIVQHRNATPAALRAAVAKVDPGEGAQLIVRGDWVIHRGPTPASACGDLVRQLQDEIRAQLREYDASDEAEREEAEL
jgi:hypothetical protein